MRYRISGHLLCHDVRLSATIETTVDLERRPSLAEAEALLWPEGNRRIVACSGEDSSATIDEIEVSEAAG